MALDASFMLTQTFLEGSAGGMLLGLGRFIVTFVKINHAHTETKYWRLITTHLVAILLFAIIGGFITWGFEGRAGNMSQGITAMLLLSLLAANLMPEFEEPDDTVAVEEESTQ